MPPLEDLKAEAEKIIFQPNKGPQTDFLSASEFEVLYGGAAGGGKTFAMVADPVRSFFTPSWRGLLLRRSTTELGEIEAASKELYWQLFPHSGKGAAKFEARSHTWKFPSGAELWLSYLDKDDDVEVYRGQSFQWIGFDEVTQWPTPYPWDFLRSRCRSDKGTGLYMRATTNPGGIGHHWVKKMFVDPAPAGRAFVAQDIETGKELVHPDTYPKGHRLHGKKNPRAGEPLFYRRFIPAKLWDNPYLTEDGKYEANLLSMPEYQRKQLLEGNWDVAEGAAFKEFNREIHTIEPFDMPRHWPRFRSCDYGYSSYSGVLWFAVADDGQIIVYREHYVKEKTVDVLADEILELEQGDRVRYGVLDSSMWNATGDRGPSRAEKMNRKRLNFRRSDRSKGSRVDGKNEIHRLLMVDEFTERPGLVIFNTCTNLISQLPSIPLDKNNPEDVDTKYQHDHLYDALRYGVMSRPKTSLFDFQTESIQKQPEPFDNTFGY